MLLGVYCLVKFSFRRHKSKSRIANAKLTNNLIDEEEKRATCLNIIDVVVFNMLPLGPRLVWFCVQPLKVDQIYLLSVRQGEGSTASTTGHSIAMFNLHLIQRKLNASRTVEATTTGLNGANVIN